MNKQYTGFHIYIGFGDGGMCVKGWGNVRCSKINRQISVRVRIFPPHPQETLYKYGNPPIEKPQNIFFIAG